MDKANKWIFIGLIILFFVLFAQPNTRIFSYLILIPLIIGGIIALIGYIIAKQSIRK